MLAGFFYTWCMEMLARILPGPLPFILAVACVPIALWLDVRSWRLCARALKSPGHDDQSRWLIQGIRSGILAIGFVCFAVGLWRFSAPWLLFGVVFLAEEIFETSIMLLAFPRRGSRS